MRTIAAVSSVLLTLVGSSASSAQGRVTAERTATLPVSGVRVVVVENGSGRLRVTGTPGATTVHATGVAHADAQGDLQHIQLSATRSGDVITVRPDIGTSWWHGCNCWMDLTVELPPQVAVEVRDGSGGAELRNVGPLQLETGSGGATVQQVNGDLRSTSGSGHLRITDVRGNAQSSSGSGGVTLEQVQGSVEIPHAGSGGVQLRNVRGSVHVGSAGSGGVSIDGVGGDVTVDHKGSGGVSTENVRGHVAVPDRR